MSIKATRVGNGSGSYADAIFIGTSQKVSTSATSAQSTALGSSTTLVRLIATKDCHIKTAANPTALADGTCLYLPSNVELRIGVVGGEKIAVIRDGVDGSLFITEALSL